MNWRSGSKTHGYIGWVKLHGHETWQGSLHIFPFTLQILDRNLQNGFDFDFWWRNTKEICDVNISENKTANQNTMRDNENRGLFYLGAPPSPTRQVTCGWWRSYLLHNCTFLQSHVGQVFCPKPSNHQKLLPLSKTHRYAVKGVEFVLYNYWQLILLFFDHFWRFLGALYATRIQSGTTMTLEREKR